MLRITCIRADSVRAVSWSEFVERVIGAESHERVGARVGVSGPTVGRWVNGATGAPRVEVAVRFARAYRVSVLETFVEAGYITANEAGAAPREVPLTNTSASAGWPWIFTSTSSAVRFAFSEVSLPDSANTSRFHGA